MTGEVASPITNQASSSPSVDPYARLIWSLLLLGVILRFYLMFSAHATEEDFFITLRYVENIANGHGFVYNVGQRVLGTTTPLYTLVLALIMKLGINPIFAGKLLGIAADACAGYFIYRLSRTVRRPIAGIAAVTLLMLAPVNLNWASKGMEVGIVAAVGAAAWAMWAEKRETAAWFCAALLALLRIDGASMAVVMLVATLVRDRKLPAKGLLCFVAVVAPWILFATLYFGSPVPLSLSAKLMVYGKLIPGRFPQLRPFLTLMLHNPLGLVLAAGFVLFNEFIGQKLLHLRRGSKLNDPDLLLIPPMLWICLHYAGMALSHVVLFGWYFVPPTPIFYLVSASGLLIVAERLRLPVLQAPPRKVSALASGLALALLAMVAPKAERTLKEGQEVETLLRIPIGNWINQHSLPDQTLMLEPIGYIGYYSRLKIIDVIGLVSPEALSSYRAEVVSPDHDLWQRLKPDWLLLRAGQLDGLDKYELTLPQSDRLTASYDRDMEWKDPQAPDRRAAFILFKRRQ